MTSDRRRRLRYERTRMANRVRRSIQDMLHAPAPFVREDGLPSWWPFWSDVLMKDVRSLVRCARALAELEREATRRLADEAAEAIRAALQQDAEVVEAAVAEGAAADASADACTLYVTRWPRGRTAAGTRRAGLEGAGCWPDGGARCRRC